MNGMMKLTLVVALGFFASGCWIIDIIWPSGFTVKTTFSTPPSPTQRGVTSPDPSVHVTGSYSNPNVSPACGNVITIDRFTDSEGKTTDRDFAAGFSWNFQRVGGHAGCGLKTVFAYMPCGGNVKLDCAAALAFAMSPQSIDLNAPPATAIFTGEGLNTTYGMPTIEFYDEYGILF